MNKIKKLANAVNTQTTAFAVAVMSMPMVAMAADTDPATFAAEKISGLQIGVAAVGGAILGITLTVVGFFVIKRMANRA